MGEEDIMVADLTGHLKQAFEEISLGANYPMPTFHGKKGENPEDHCMKAEDYFKVYKIVDDEDKRKWFTDTLFLTVRRWAEQLPDTVKNYDFNPDDEASKEVSIKYQFLQRFAVKGRTTEAMYTAWIQLSFDSSKDDIEEFINEVKNLAKRLGYNEQAQVMAIKNNLPLELYHNWLTINKLKDLTDFLVKVYNNPKKKEKLVIRDQTASASRVATHGTFQPRGQNFANRVNKRYGMNQNGNFRPGGRFGGRGRFDDSPNVRCPRVASKTVDKDKGRCYYCKEFAHFVNKCTKKIEDERGQA